MPVLEVTSEGNLECSFQDAAGRVERGSIASVAGSDQLLVLYGLYKQATCGPCTTFRPPFFQIKNRSKWAAWKNLEDMPGKIAKQLYVALVDELLPKLQGPEKKGELMGPVVSTMGAETLEGEDVPEWGSPHIMASEGNLAGVERLLEEGTPVDSRDSEGCSALHWACDRGSLEMVELLLMRGADPKVKDNDGQTPLEYAILCGHLNVVERMKAAEYKDKHPGPPLAGDSEYLNVEGFAFSND